MEHLTEKEFNSLTNETKDAVMAEVRRARASGNTHKLEFMYMKIRHELRSASFNSEFKEVERRIEENRARINQKFKETELRNQLHSQQQAVVDNDLRAHMQMHQQHIEQANAAHNNANEQFHQQQMIINQIHHNM